MSETQTPNLNLSMPDVGTEENDWGNDLNAIFEKLDDQLGGVFVKDVSGGATVVLSEQEADHHTIIFTGALTANISVIFPDRKRNRWIANDTTGAFTLTVKTVGGVGVEIPQGRKAAVSCDGTDMRAWFTEPAAASLSAGGLITLASTDEARAATDANKALTPRAARAARPPSIGNWLIDGDFRIWPEGEVFQDVPFATYTASMWRYGGVADGTPARVTITRGITEDAPFADHPISFLRITNSDQGSNLGPDSTHVLLQRQRDPYAFAGQTVTYGFWARSSIANKRIGVNIRQHFGAEGSPPQTSARHAFHTLGPDWALCTGQINVQPVIGKDVRADAFFAFQILFQWGANRDDEFGTSGGQGWQGTGTIDIARVMLVHGPTLPMWDERPIEVDLQRFSAYYAKSYNMADKPGTNTEAGAIIGRMAGLTHAEPVSWPRMLATPTVIPYSTTGQPGHWRNRSQNTNYQVFVGAIGETGCFVGGVAGSTLDLNSFGGHYAADARP